MRNMKESGIDWIGKIPENWKIGKVKDIFIRKNEKANDEKPTVLSLARSGVKIRDISTGEGQLAESYNNYNPVEIGDLLLNPMDLYSGANCSVSKVKGVISPAYINLRAKGKNNSTYYDYFFKTQYWGMVLFAHGKGVSFDNRWTLGLDTALNYFIPVPKETEQDKIAVFLDKRIYEIDNIIEKTKDTIEDYKKYKHSLITEIITNGLEKNKDSKESGIDWIGKIPENFDIYKIKYLGNARNGLTYSPENICDEEKGILVLRSSNIVNGKISLLDNVYVNKEIKDELKIRKNDILICSRNGSRKLIGKNAIISQDIDATFGAFMMVFRGDKNPKYIKYILDSDIFNYYLATFLTSTINQLTYDNFSNMKVVYTSDIEQQEKIVEYLDKKCEKIDKLIYDKEKIIEELEEYKKSLIYEYVTGKKEVV